MGCNVKVIGLVPENTAGAYCTQLAATAVLLGKLVTKKH
jgi:hypothetical protein